jgi:hypothetical protein
MDQRIERTITVSNLTEHARDELTRAGLFDKDSDYNGMLGTAVMELMEVFAKQGHSGASAALTTQLFSKLSRYQTLMPITSDPQEWMGVSGQMNYECWQHKRQPSVFSTDGGKTWYDLDDPDQKNWPKKGKS